jgi:hypothetical protein
MFRHTGLQATTTEISSHMIWQSYWKMYHWQSEHECGTCVRVLRAVRDVLSYTCHGRRVGRDGPTAWPPRSTPDLNLLDFYLCGHLNTLCMQLLLTTKHYLIVDACQTIRNCPGTFARMWRTVMRRVVACKESHGGYFEHL